MPVYVQARFEVRLLWDGGPLTVREYTGKLVKGLLSVCSERLRRELSEAARGRAKRVSVSPLFRVRGAAGIEAVYPGGPSPDRITWPRIASGEMFFFLVGLGGDLVDAIDDVVDCLSDGVELRFGGRSVRVEPYAFHASDYWVSEEGPRIDVCRYERLKFTFLSPALPVNPWRPGSRWKRLLPAPSYLFAVNAHDLFDPDASLFWRALVALEKILSPPYTALNTARVRWFVYDYHGRETKPEPGLIGYTVFHVECDRVSSEEARLASTVLSHAAFMGIGSGRAAGFGVVSLAAASGAVEV